MFNPNGESSVSVDLETVRQPIGLGARLLSTFPVTRLDQI